MLLLFKHLKYVIKFTRVYIIIIGYSLKWFQNDYRIKSNDKKAHPKTPQTPQKINPTQNNNIMTPHFSRAIFRRAIHLQHLH